MFKVPFFCFASTVIHIDDNESTLRGVKNGLSKNSNCLLKSFSKPEDALTYINSYVSPISGLPLLDNIDYSEGVDFTNHVTVDLNLSNIFELLNKQNKHSEISLVIVDYKMPGINGIDLCKQIKHLPAKKILLTSHAEYKLATEALESGLIDKLIIKNESNTLNNLRTSVSALINQYFVDLTKHLLLHSAIHPFKDDTFTNFLADLKKRHKLTGHYAIDRYGSLILEDEHRNNKLLVIHTDESLDYFVDLYSESAHLNKYLDKIRTRSQLPFFNNYLYANVIETDKWNQLLFDSSLLRGDKNYYYCLRDFLTATA